MRNTLLTFLVLLFVVGCNTSKSPNKSTQNNAYFKIQIEQDGRIVSPFKNAIFLNKKPFKFNIEMKGVEGISVGAMWNDTLYNFPSNRNIFFCDDEDKYENCGFFSAMTMAMEHFNINKELPVGGIENQQYWFYSKEQDWHRFDKEVIENNGSIFATFTVEKIDEILEEDNREYPINLINKDIYMVFAAEIPNDISNSHKELQREKFILKFK